MKLMTPDIYWNSQPVELRAFRTMEDYTARGVLATQLMATFAIDRAILVDQAMDPATCQQVRVNNGFTWVPAINQPNLPTMPNCPVPGLPPYDPNNPPAGSIKVSIDAADYPAQPDIPPAPVPQTKLGDAYPMPDGSIAWLPGPGLNESTASNGEKFVEGGETYTITYDMTNKLPTPTIYITKDQAV